MIIEAFFTLTQDAREKVTAEIITSVPLSEDLARRLESELSKSDQESGSSSSPWWMIRSSEE